MLGQKFVFCWMMMMLRKQFCLNEPTARKTRFLPEKSFKSRGRNGPLGLFLPRLMLFLGVIVFCN
jgi:hypothetical protein